MGTPLDNQAGFFSECSSIDPEHVKVRGRVTMVKGFRQEKIAVEDVVINLVVGGSGPSTGPGRLRSLFTQQCRRLLAERLPRTEQAKQQDRQQATRQCRQQRQGVEAKGRIHQSL